MSIYCPYHQVPSVFPDTRQDFSLAMTLVAQHRIDLGPIFSSTFALADSAHAFDLCENHKEKEIKVLIDLQDTVAKI
jgi:threonine dehydrogenase-like Zn-dependent dehydrogenase